jgi:phenylacetate-CoA ligase
MSGAENLWTHPLDVRRIVEGRRVLPEAIARLSWSREQVEAEQQRALRQVVAAAKNGSAFWAEWLDEVDAATVTAQSLTVAPPVSKETVMENWDALVTDPALTLAGANEHLERLHADAEAPHYFLDRYYLSATGGSSGKRGVFVWDEGLATINPLITYRQQILEEQREPSDEPKRTAVICAPRLSHASRFLFPTPVNPDREMRVFPADLPIDTLIKELQAYQPDVIVGYASLVQEVCLEALQGRLSISPRRIYTNSEPLLPEIRAAAREAFGIEIHNSWGCVEGGILGVEGDSFSGITLAEDYNLFEFVNDDFQVVKAGDIASRILLTKLIPGVMPLIRYEVTDSVIFSVAPNPDAPGYRRITEICGRADVWFRYGTTKVHPMVFRGVLGQNPLVGEYQVFQTTNGARVDVLARNGYVPATDQESLIHALRKAGLAEPVVQVQAVTHLQRIERTGKLQRFVALAGE